MIIFFTRILYDFLQCDILRYFLVSLRVSTKLYMTHYNYNICSRAAKLVALGKINSQPERIIDNDTTVSTSDVIHDAPSLDFVCTALDNAKSVDTSATVRANDFDPSLPSKDTDTTIAALDNAEFVHFSENDAKDAVSAANFSRPFPNKVIDTTNTVFDNANYVHTSNDTSTTVSSTNCDYSLSCTDIDTTITALDNTNNVHTSNIDATVGTANFSYSLPSKDTDTLITVLDSDESIPSTGFEATDSTSNLATTKSGSIRKRKARNPLSPRCRKLLKQECVVASHALKTLCGNSCRRKCITKLSEVQRLKLNEEFWKMNWSDRRMYIVTSVKRQNVVQCTTGSKTKRSKSNFYFFPNERGEQVCVCKVFFLTTLDFDKKNDAVVHRALSQMDDGSILPRIDKRGRGKCQRKVDRSIICKHVESYNPCVSHYRREYAPNRKYLPSDITIQMMYDDFKRKFADKCSYNLYRSVVRDMGISFTKLGHEQCEGCENFALHDKAHTKNNLNMTCDECRKWHDHIQRADASRAEYRQDRDTVSVSSNTIIFSADLQKVIMLPRIDVFKTVLFTRRIIAFNESFVPLGSNPLHNPVAVLWHEGIAGRRKEEIVSTFHAFLIQHRDAHHVKLWLDNCAAQNKNWCLFSFFVYVINSDEVAAESIQLKFFEPGHTFMSADHFHHQVEKSMKQMNKVYDFDDFLTCVGNANSKRVTVKAMDAHDF